MKLTEIDINISICVWVRELIDTDGLREIKTLIDVYIER